ncbi:MAG TPA: TadE family protein, partial [Planctomycetia bacterium]|nr:TadE family protein [Planctomycetia bacterium]
ALVVPIFVLVLFAIFEYGRIFMTKHVMDAAAREGVRFAIVNADYGTVDQVEDVIDVRLDLIRRFFIPGSLKTEVFWIDKNGAERTPYNDAPFGMTMGVRVDGDYRPIFPRFVMSGRESVNFKSACFMLSEAN